MSSTSDEGSPRFISYEGRRRGGKRCGESGASKPKPMEAKRVGQKLYYRI
jgi:hypothetical protein